ncbi:MAG: hypothetical protein EOP53_16315 [Sphingobacteriales bacterium]|nr:MAG: hypothetical protein EOP53_16315 [Sphingobacteriales bacterium]
MFSLKNTFAFILLTCLLVGGAAFKAGTPKFPTLTATTLSGKPVTLPKQTEGKFAVLGIAYSIKAQDDLNTWYQPIYSQVMENKFIPAQVYFIPMTGNIKGMSQDKIKSKMKEGMDSEWHKYVLVYQQDPDNYIKELNMTEKEKPYIFVLNPRGEIVYQTSGEFTEKKMESIIDKLSE